MEQETPRGPLRFADLFDLDEVQSIQDAFALAAGVASIIVDPDGTPLTRPSNSTPFCSEVARGTAVGRALCMHSERVAREDMADGPLARPCLNCGLWEGGARICVGDQHLASWLVGQVRDAAVDDDRARAHAREIGVDEGVFVAALADVPEMPRARFEKVCRALVLFAGLLSRQAARNVQLHGVVAAKERAEAERDRLEEHMRQAAKLEALGRLAGGVAHDFNNLLTAIRGYGEMLLSEVDDRPEAYELVRSLLGVSSRATEVVRGLLDFSRREKQRSEPVPLNAVVREVARLLEHSLDRLIDVRLELDVDDPIVIGDSGQLQNALLNLAINSRDAMPQGGVLTMATRLCDLGADDVRMHPHMTGPGRYVEVRVTDTGLGMNADTRDRIFEPFFTTKPAGAGTGLGLSGVYGCVKSHRGGVDVQSEPGEGTSVLVLLPLAVGAVTLAPDAAAPVAMPAATGVRARVLVVDDEDPVRDLVVKVFQRAGYEVTEARDGVEAVTCFDRASGAFDLVVLDLVMPRLAGDEVITELRDRDGEVNVLGISGGTDGDPAARMLGAGARGFMAKPFRPGDLLALAAQIMNEQPRARGALG